MTTLTLVTYINPENVTQDFIVNNVFDHVTSHANLWAEQHALEMAYDKYHEVGYYAFDEDGKLVAVCKPQ